MTPTVPPSPAQIWSSVQVMPLLLLLMGTCSPAENPHKDHGASKNPHMHDAASKNPYKHDGASKNPYMHDGASKNPYMHDGASKNPYMHDAASKNPYMHDGEYTTYMYENNNPHGDMPERTEFGTDWAKLSGRMQQPKCLEIPSNLTLCQNIGYNRMLLPNLLEHDTLKEVTQQASSWVPLVRIKCHPDTKVFLCSLFSPICIGRRIFPCRSLCLGVKASCEYRMIFHGFVWPEMLECEKFPEDNDMCISLQNDVKPDHRCMACKHPQTHEVMIDHFCRADVAIRATLKQIKDRDSHKELILRKKRRILKSSNMTKREVRSLTPILQHGAHCDCDTINKTNQRYLLMGTRQGQDLIVNFGMVWNRKDKEFKKGLRVMRKGNLCEGGIFHEISNNGINVNGSSSKSQRKKRRKKGKGKGKKKGKAENGGKRRGGKKGRKNRKNKGRGKKNRKQKGNKKMTITQREDQTLSNLDKVAQ